MTTHQIADDNAGVAASQCSTCPFRSDGLQLSAEAMAAIHVYLAQGTNHFCHSDDSDKTICRGGRDFQLTLFHRLGWITETTDEALAAAMQAKGIEPKRFISRKVSKQH